SDIANTHFFLATREIGTFVKAEYELANGISDMNVAIPEMLREQNGTRDEVYCLITPEVHNMWKRLKKVDLQVCLNNDEFNRKLRAMHPPTFCEQTTSFSRCM
ncbi:hypothetical protein PFISCL1PPCAC_12055, partial [Pristionchus fissidentatus]